MHTGTGKYMAAVGMFDGLHTGHRFVLGELRRHAAMRGMQPMVITFANHPSDILRPDNMPHLLMSVETKRRAISDLTGIQTVEVLQFTAEFAAMTAQEFLNKLKSRGVAALVMGFNNHIGSDRLDAKQAKGLGIIDIEELQACPGDENASSSCLRKAVSQADFAAAKALLGHNFTIEGSVVHGRKLGRTIGFPTANIQPHLAERQLLPPDGVYAADVMLKGENRTHRAIVNIGHRPTVDHSDTPARTIEAHILDFSGDIYGCGISLTFLSALRAEQRFPSLEALRTQLTADAEAARHIQASDK